MSNSVEYRAWDENMKCMITWEDMQSDWESEGYSRSIFTYDHWVPMQFTGLYDEASEPIYESDIVEINGHKYKIKYEIGAFMLVKLSEDTDMYEQFDNCWNDNCYPLAQYYWDSNSDENRVINCRVIGNYYQGEDKNE